jgi:hypothetical protein
MFEGTLQLRIVREIAVWNPMSGRALARVIHEPRLPLSTVRDITVTFGNQPLGVSPRFPGKPDANAFRLIRHLFLERC